MIALRLLELVLLILIGWVGVTQIILPPLFGLPFFPALRRRWHHVEDELNATHETLEYQQWMARVRALKDKENDSVSNDFNAS